MGGGSLGRYVYWSARRIEAFASENGIALGDGAGYVVKTPGLSALPQVEWNIPGRTRTRLEIARSVEDAVGHLVPGDFDAVAPPVQFARGTGTVEVAEFIAPYATTPPIVLHTRIQTPEGRRVDVCLFGSMDNMAGFQRCDAVHEGWTSSAMLAIQELLDTRGRKNTSQWNDEQARAVEALKIALEQGTTPRDNGKGSQIPQLRGYTLGQGVDCEWWAEIYTDVELDPERWSFTGMLEGTGRIMVGAPLWVRAEHITRYRRASGTGPLRFLHRPKRALSARQRAKAATTLEESFGPSAKEPRKSR